MSREEIRKVALDLRAEMLGVEPPLPLEIPPIAKEVIDSLWTIMGIEPPTDDSDFEDEFVDGLYSLDELPESTAPDTPTTDREPVEHKPRPP
jgi:hypothetical protein